MELLAGILSCWSQLHAWRPPRWGHVEGCRLLPVPTLPGLTNVSTVVIIDHAKAAVVWHVASLEFVPFMLTPFPTDADENAVGFQCSNSVIGHGGCWVLVPLQSGLSCRINNQGFAPSLPAAPLTWRWPTLHIDLRKVSIGCFQFRIISGFLRLCWRSSASIKSKCWHVAGATPAKNSVQFVCSPLLGRLENLPCWRGMCFWRCYESRFARRPADIVANKSPHLFCPAVDGLLVGFYTENDYGMFEIPLTGSIDVRFSQQAPLGSFRECLASTGSMSHLWSPMYSSLPCQVWNPVQTASVTLPSYTI